MKYLSMLLLSVAAGFCGCDDTNTTRTTPGTATTPGTGNLNPTVGTTRDLDTSDKTPIDQNENSADIDTTASIRQRIVATEMSVNAHNIKIITQNGQVTLRGEVETEAEKTLIDDIANEVAGEGKVDNQLQIDVD